MADAHSIALKRNNFQKYLLIAATIFFTIAVTTLAINKYFYTTSTTNLSDEKLSVLLEKANENYSNGKFESALPYLEEASSRGSSKAQYSLGYMYQNGEGVEKDLDLAKSYFQSAAKQGHLKAKNTLKNMGK